MIATQTAIENPLDLKQYSALYISMNFFKTIFLSG